MRITIIGWYGTETIGDRAILAGLVQIFCKAFHQFDIKLGSLYPFFSRRTLTEDLPFYQKITGRDFKIDLFDSRNCRELDRAIDESDLIVMGGGPLMHVNPIFMVEYAFKRAKELKKKTALLGCGIGPIFSRKHQKSLLRILKDSDCIVLRDSTSRENLLELAEKFKVNLSCTRVFTSFDPAVQCALDYLKTFESGVSNNGMPSEDFIAVNLRKFPDGYGKNINSTLIDNSLCSFVKSIVEKFPKIKIYLIPMHYFHVGDDDREFLNKIHLEVNTNFISVFNKPLSLLDTMKVFQKAKFCIGMRFHSVVLQTILNGKNYILDYTEPKMGKITGFLDFIDSTNFYKDRYICLQNQEVDTKMMNEKSIQNAFNFDQEMIISELSTYVACIKELM